LPRGKVDWASVYLWGGVIFRDIGAMSLFEFAQAVRGHSLANGAKPKSNAEISEDRLSDLGIEGF